MSDESAMSMMSSTPGNPTSTPSPEEVDFVRDVLRAEAEAIVRLADVSCSKITNAWTKAISMMVDCTGHVVVSGMGKSGLIGAKMSATLSSVGIPSHVVHPAEAVHGDLGRIRRGDVAVLLSYSGETEEVVNLAAILKADAVNRVGISGKSESTLARLSDVHLDLGDVTEACPLNLAPTASTTAMLAMGDALAMAASRRLSFTADDFQRCHPGGLLGAALKPVTEVLRFRVGENLPAVSDAVTVREALDQAAGDRRAGAIVLINAEGRLSGIFTDADLRRLVRADPDGMSKPISSVMTTHPRHLTADQLVRDAVQVVREHRLDEIPVVDESGRPVGLIDVQDLITMRIVQE